MAVYAIGDLHLSLTADKPMDVFGGVWDNYIEKLREGFAGLTAEDVVVLCGDLSWGMGLEQSREDFRFLASLPGKKLILKGNHDFWWSTAARAKRFFHDNGFENIDILHNNCYQWGDLALCGTRGWFYEEEKGAEHDRKIMLREIGRLETSLKAAGEREKLVFLHYPPLFQHYECPEILQLLNDYRVGLCCYGHLHGKSCRLAFEGWRGCTEFRLVSADHLDFAPALIRS